MFQFGRFPAYAYFIQRMLTEYCSAGFPHSDICGSTLICSSPQLIAACHVLHRLPVPRHSPCALFYLTSRFPLVSCWKIQRAYELCESSSLSSLLAKSYLPFLLSLQATHRANSTVLRYTRFLFSIQFSRCMANGSGPRTEFTCLWWA